MNQVQLKELVKACLPTTIQDHIIRPLLQRWREPARAIDLSPLRLIREAKTEDLADPKWLETMLPRLGLNSEWLHQFPSSLYPYTGKGLRHWQYPNQFSKYLAQLSEYDIESYLEIGVRHGGTFCITVEYLNRFHPIQKAIGVDIRPCPGLEEYRRTNPRARFEVSDSQKPAFKRLVETEGPFDLVLIDGDHTEEGCRRDFENLKQHARIFVFHDIVSDPVPGVIKVWQDVKEAEKDNFDFFEYTDQYEECVRRRGERLLGIGVAVKRNPGVLH